MDSIVEWCRQESLYVVMTFGGPIKNTNLQKVLDIWEFYAPRYADQTHVVYEIKNEGCYETYHCAEPVMQTYREIIRKHAPDTHVLLLSHSNLKGGINSLWEDVDRLSTVVDWSNGSFAFHGYAPSAGEQVNMIRELGAKGYAMTCTEFPNSGELVRAYESAGISYAHFEACWGGNRSLGDICAHVKKYGISWQPDFGDWPQPHVDHVPLEAKAARHAPARNRDGTVIESSAVRSLPQTDMCVVYDLAGRVLWRRPDICTGVRRPVPHFSVSAGQQVVIVKHQASDTNRP
jgi:hypothetical protein